MTEMRKLRVIVFEKDIDAVLRFLGEAGVVQFIDVRDKFEALGGVLDSCEAPAEALSQCSSIPARIDHLLEDLELEPEELPIRKAPLSEKSLEEALSDVERRLSDIEDRSRPFIEVLALSSNILSRIDRLFKDLKVKPEKLPAEKVSLSEKPPEEVLKEAELRLFQIESRSDNIAKITARRSIILSSINRSIKRLKVKETAVEKRPVPTKLPEEVFLEIEEVLPKIENRSKEIVKALSRCSKILSRIDRLFGRLKERRERLPVEKVSLEWVIPYPLPEKPLEEIERDILAEIENKVSNIESRIRTVGLKKLIESSERVVLAKEALTIRTAAKEAERQFSDAKNSLAEEAFNARTIIVEIGSQLSEQRTVLAKEALTIKRLAELERKSVKTKPEIKEFSEELSLRRRSIQRRKEVMEVKAKFGKVATTVYFEAWVPQIHMKRVVNGIRETTSDNCLITDETPAHEETAPIILKRLGFMQAFRGLTTAFGYPSWDEINPTPLMTVTFPILFGIMFADVGQGAILVILGVILAYFRRKVKMKEVGDIARYLLIGGEMFMLYGISSIFWGFLFGEFFGPSGLIHPISLGKIGPFYFGGFEPTHEPMKMLKFAIFVGVIHLSLGIILKIINEIKKERYRLVLIPICWLWLLLGGLFMWLYWGGISNISKWFAEGIFMFAGLIISPLMLIMLFTGMAEGFTEGIGFGVEVFTATLGNTISYGRLMALGLIHSSMNAMFLMLGGVELGHFPLTSIPVIAAGTILVMIIEGLIIFVHTLRLHWVEWFSKFYTGRGTLFKPFTLNNTTGG